MSAPTSRLRQWLSAFPVPHEHGAWAMLLVPMCVVLLAVRPTSALPAFLLTLAVLATFLAQHAALLVVRGRDEPETRLWLACFLLAAAAGGLPLLLVFERILLLVPVGLGLLFFLAHALVSRTHAGRKRVRSQRWELLSVAVMALTAPSAYITVRGQLDPGAWAAWGLCTLFFMSSVFYVKLLLAGARLRKNGGNDAWRGLQRPVLVFHLLLLLGLCLLSLWLEPITGVFLGAAFLPALVRALVGATRAEPHIPRLKQVGIAEVLYSVWFLIFASHGLTLWWAV